MHYCRAKTGSCSGSMLADYLVKRSGHRGPPIQPMPMPPMAPSTTTGSGDTRQTTSRMKPTRASAKMPGSRRRPKRTCACNARCPTASRSSPAAKSRTRRLALGRCQLCCFEPITLSRLRRHGRSFTRHGLPPNGSPWIPSTRAGRSQCLPLREAGAAHELLEKGGGGKILLTT